MKFQMHGDQIKFDGHAFEISWPSVCKADFRRGLSDLNFTDRMTDYRVIIYRF